MKTAAYDQKTKKGTGLLQKNSSGGYYVTTVAPVKIFILNDREINPKMLDHMVEFEIADSFLDDDGHIDNIEGNYIGKPKGSVKIQEMVEQDAAPSPMDMEIPGLDVMDAALGAPPTDMPGPEMMGGSEDPLAEELSMTPAGPGEDPLSEELTVPAPPMASKKANKLRIVKPDYVPAEMLDVFRGAVRVARSKGILLNRAGKVNAKALRLEYTDLLKSYHDLVQ